MLVLIIKWLGTDQATSHYLNQWCLVYWQLGLNELNDWNGHMKGHIIYLSKLSFACELACMTAMAGHEKCWKCESSGVCCFLWPLQLQHLFQKATQLPDHLFFCQSIYSNQQCASTKNLLQVCEICQDYTHWGDCLTTSTVSLQLLGGHPSHN